MKDDWGNLDFFEDNFKCPHCGSDEVVLPIGSATADVLLVAEYPGKEEIKRGKPMVGAMGGVLRTELALVGFDIQATRRTNLWKHTPNKNIDCFNLGMEEVIKEAQGKKAILLFGDDCVKCFLDDVKVTEITGMKVKSKFFSAPLIMACSNPAIVFKPRRGVGELRLTLRKFVEALNNEGWTK